DRDLADTRLLHDAHDLADALGSRAVDAAGGERLVTARALADRLEQRLGLLAEEREQQQLLLRGGDALGLFAKLLEVDGLRVLMAVCEQVDRTPERGVDGRGRPSEATLDKVAQLVDHRRIAVRRENVEERL